MIGKLVDRLRSGVPRGTWLLMVLSGLSIVTAYLREAAFAYLFGASGELDALLVALTIPRLLALLSANITVAVVLPVYVGYREVDQHGHASELVRRWFWMLAAVGTAICVVLLVAASPLVTMMAPGLTPEHKALAALCLRGMLPFVWLMTVAPCFKVVLDTHRRFAGPALGTSIANVSVVVTSVLFAASVGVVGAVPGFAAGAALTFALLWARSKPVEPALPGLRRRAEVVTLPLAGAGIMAVNVAANQFHIIIDRGFASGLAEGSIAALNYAKSVNIIPATVVSAALATALFPLLATMTARGEWREALHTVYRWIGVVTGLGLIPVVGLILLRVPVVELLFQRGEFDEQAVTMTASVLSVLPAMILITSICTLLDRLLLAQRRLVILAVLSVSTIALKVLFNVVFVSWLDRGLVGLAWATILSTGLVTLARFWAARRRGDWAKGGPTA